MMSRHIKPPINLDSVNNSAIVLSSYESAAIVNISSSNTSVASTLLLRDHPTELRWSALWLGVIVAMTAGGNVLVCLAVCCERRLQNMTNYFLMSLAIADLLVSLAVMPFAMVVEIFGYFPMQANVCVVWASMDVLLCTASIWHMSTMSLDRYCTIRFPMSYGRNRTKSTVTIKIAFVWIVSLAVSSGLAVSGFLDYSNVYTDGQCIPVVKEFVVYGSLMAFYVPLVIMIITYALTIRILAENGRTMKELGLKTEMVVHRRNDQSSHCHLANEHESTIGGRNSMVNGRGSTLQLPTGRHSPQPSTQRRISEIKDRSSEIPPSDTAESRAQTPKFQQQPREPTINADRSALSLANVELGSNHNVDGIMTRGASCVSLDPNAAIVARAIPDEDEMGFKIEDSKLPTSADFHDNFMQEQSIDREEDQSYELGANGVQQQQQRNISAQSTMSSRSNSFSANEPDVSPSKVLFTRPSIVFEVIPLGKEIPLHIIVPRLEDGSLLTDSCCCRSPSVHCIRCELSTTEETYSPIKLTTNENLNSNCYSDGNAILDHTFETGKPIFQRVKVHQLKRTRSFDSINSYYSTSKNRVIIDDGNGMPISGTKPQNSAEKDNYGKIAKFCEPQLLLKRDTTSYNEHRVFVKSSSTSNLSISTIFTTSASREDSFKKPSVQLLDNTLKYNQCFMPTNSSHDDAITMLANEAAQKTTMLDSPMSKLSPSAHCSKTSLDDSISSVEHQDMTQVVIAPLYRRKTTCDKPENQRANLPSIVLPQSSSSDAINIKQTTTSNGHFRSSRMYNYIVNNRQRRRDSAMTDHNLSSLELSWSFTTYPNREATIENTKTTNAFSISKSHLSTTSNSNERKASKVLGIIFSVFIALWSPFFVVNVVSALCGDRCQLHAVLGPTVMSWVVWLGYTSSLANPFIYTLFSTKFRTVFRRIVTCQAVYCSNICQRNRRSGIDDRRSARVSMSHTGGPREIGCRSTAGLSWTGGVGLRRFSGNF